MCIPCIVIPFVLWFFYKYIQPYIAKIWNPWKKVEGTPIPDGGGDSAKMKCPFKASDQSDSERSESESAKVKNGDLSEALTNGHPQVSAAVGDKKRD